MSGFLDRMAARAGGVVPEVAPRVPALFESTVAATAPTARSPLEVNRPPVGSAAPPPALHARFTGGPPASTAEVGPVTQQPAGREASSVGPAAAAPARPPAPGPARTGGRVSIHVPPVTGAAGQVTASGPRRSRPAVLVSPAVPVPLATAAPAGAPPESSDAVRGGPSVVRVSIGRVDVRMPAAPPRPASPPEPVPAAKADRLSLQDYLHGQRGPR
jgi:hypothetical protein